MKYEKSAGAIVYYVNKEIKFLLLKYPTYWGFAKGLVEENEKEEETAVRELEEEAGLKGKIIPGFKFKQEWFFRLNNETIKKKATFFLVKVSEEEAEKVKISFEHEEFAWLTFSEAIEKMKIKSNKEMLRKAYEFIFKFEKQKTIFNSVS